MVVVVGVVADVVVRGVVEVTGADVVVIARGCEVDGDAAGLSGATSLQAKRRVATIESAKHLTNRRPSWVNVAPPS